ncbi:MAG: UDP-N-acetylmuramate--L-alanine ligase [Patescibacteria group bacterium]
MDLSKVKKIYMIGIKGVGMTMLAQYFCGQGIEVMGSDIEEKFMTDKVLDSLGIKVFEHFDENNIARDADLIVYSTAYNAERNIEVAKALTGKIRTLTYAEAMGEVFNQKFGIAVCGSHGKTTTTAWLGYVLSEAGEDPSVMVGSYVPQFKGASLIGKSDYLVIEADEYQNKLKSFSPKAVLLNNIDYDHPDFFKTPEDYEDVFIQFIQKITKKGFLVAYFDDPIIVKFARVNCKGRVIGYSIENKDADILAYDLRHETGSQFFKVKLKDDEGYSELGEFKIKLSGLHNIYNALAVIAASIELGVELKDIRGALGEFAGTARRMQVMGEFRGATVVDDYAHHPTEIKATLSGARQLYGGKKIIAVFHPHTFTRTKTLLDDFAQSFKDADEIVILDIYGSAREAQGGVHSKDLIDKIKGQEVKYVPTLDEVEKYLREHIERNDVILLMGAGDVFRVGERLVKM